MKYEINSKELESCVVELFGTNFEQIQKDDGMTFLTCGGQIIGCQCRLFTAKYNNKLISSDSEIFTGSTYIDESIRFEISNIIIILYIFYTICIIFRSKSKTKKYMVKI